MPIAFEHSRGVAKRLFQQKQRYYFIDLVRFVAVLFMIQGHVFDALLSPQVKALPWYYMLDFFHGFVAPAFFLSLIHISEPTRLLSISYAVFCLKKKK